MNDGLMSSGKNDGPMTREGLLSCLAGLPPGEAMTRLAELAQADDGKRKLPKCLPLTSIDQLANVFQTRNGIDDWHVDQLARIIRANDAPLDALLVWPAAPLNMLLDGHHRVAAYEQARWKGPIPVRWFGGGALDALMTAGLANSKAKLSMTSRERQDYAWRLVRIGGLSKAQSASTAGVSAATIARMRVVLKALGEDAGDYKQWWQAMCAAKGEDAAPSNWSDEDREAWVNDTADEYAERMHKTFGPTLARQPDITAIVLKRLFGKRFPDLAEAILANLEDGEREALTADDDLPF